MSKTAAIVQSNYIPWKGYFDLINLADEFILFDDMQYTPRDWRNRNKVKTPNGLLWLTIPVEVKGKRFQKIKDTQISDPDWSRRHWQTIVHSYGTANFFDRYRDTFQELYTHSAATSLSQVNHAFIVKICELLNIKTRISWSMDYTMAEGKTERLLSLCQQVNADVYLSGPAARDYMQEDLFTEAGIQVRYMDYSGYPEYEQLYPPFDHAVSILDLIFNTGPDAHKYMKSFSE